MTYRRVIPRDLFNEANLLKWAERQADYMAECRRRAWEHLK